MVEVRARRRRTSSSGPMTASRLAPRSAKTLNRKPAEAISWKKFTGVCSAAARMWPAVSWTDQPWHQDWAAH